VAAVALIALVIADAVTYQELRSFLYSKIDQSLEQSHMPIEGALGSRPPPLPPNLGGGGGGSGVTPPPTSTTTDDPAEAAGGGTGGAARPKTTKATQTTQAASTVAVPTCFGFHDLSPELLQQLPPDSFVEVRSATGSVLCSKTLPGFGTTDTGSPKLPAHITGFSANTADYNEPTVYFTAADTDNDDPQYRIRASVLEEGPYVGGQLIVGVSLQSTVGTLDRLVGVELAVTGAALAAALLLGWWLVRIGLRPLRAVEGTAEAIARGELAQRVPGDEARTEVGRLARALNVMLGRIESAFAQRDATEEELRHSEGRMRRFVADASHELRTPLTAVSAYAELFEQGAVTRPEDLERVMQGIRNETARMGHLVEDLLLLARLDEGRPLARDEVELVGVAAEAVQTATTVGPAWPVQLVARHPVEVVGDHLRLRQVLDNLLANVRTHCPPGTAAVVTVSAEGDEALIKVRDDGPGLDADAAARVFERFYRADPSRSRLHGGTGLGLSIVASIVKAQGGTVTVEPGRERGTTFVIRLPRTGQEEEAADSGDAPHDTGDAPGDSQVAPS
jgi:two-component system OmpR family sensor kinase